MLDRTPSVGEAKQLLSVARLIAARSDDSRLFARLLPLSQSLTANQGESPTAKQQRTHTQFTNKPSTDPKLVQTET